MSLTVKAREMIRFLYSFRTRLTRLSSFCYHPWCSFLLSLLMWYYTDVHLFAFAYTHVYYRLGSTYAGCHGIFSFWHWWLCLLLHILSPSIFLPILWFHFSLELTNIPFFLYLPSFQHPFICWWTTRCVPSPSLLTRITVVNMRVQWPLWWDMDLSGNMLRSEVTGSCASSVFNFLSSLQTEFHKGCVNLYSHQEWIQFL